MYHPSVDFGRLFADVNLHIRRKRLLSSGFLADELLPMLPLPLSAAAFLHRSCILDLPFILIWLTAALLSLYLIHRAFHKNLEEAGVQLEALDYEI